MSKNNSNPGWKISQEQFDVLTNCSKLNNFFYINKNINAVISLNAIDDSFSAFFVCENFNFKTDRDNIVIHNLSTILKTIKTIGRENCQINFEEKKFDIVDLNGKIKCNFLYADKKLINNIEKVYDNYKDIISGVKDNTESKTFKFTKEYFASVKVFSSSEHNTLSFSNNAIILYDNTGSTEIKEKSNIEIKIDSDIKEEIRFDLDLNLFNLISADDYICTLSPDGFILFQSEDGNMTYGMASNIL